MSSSISDQAIEVDPALLADTDVDDYESAGFKTDTASLTSSINEYVFENGRRYHAYFGAEKNMMPTDEAEQDRLDMHHEIMLLLLQRELHKAPLDGPQRILDVGTGTGIWAIDMADKYPMAEVIGTDLSPIQPRWVPPNCRFEIDDAENEWTFPSDHFDFIHVRNLGQAVLKWPTLMKETYRCMKPGGYVELAELTASLHCDDGPIADDNGSKLYMDRFTEAMVKCGRLPATSKSMEKYLQDAGFVDIKLYKYKQPWGPWARDRRLKHAGAMILAAGETGFQAYGIAAFTRILGMDAKAAQDLCKEGLRSIRNKNNHLYNYFLVMYGRKPDEAEN